MTKVSGRTAMRKQMATVQNTSKLPKKEIQEIISKLESLIDKGSFDGDYYMHQLEGKSNSFVL